jgi:hypothetical protein
MQTVQIFANPHQPSIDQEPGHQDLIALFPRLIVWLGRWLFGCLVGWLLVVGWFVVGCWLLVGCWFVGWLLVGESLVWSFVDLPSSLSLNLQPMGNQERILGFCIKGLIITHFANLLLGVCVLFGRT